MTTFNAYNTSYPFSINDECEELAYQIWEANRLLVMARAEGNTKLANAMYSRLCRLGYSIQNADTDFQFTV